MNRRELLVLGSTAIVWPFAARAQPKAMPMVVGSLAAASFIFDDDAFPPRLHAAMQAAGWQRGRDYRLVVRSGDGTNEAYPALVRELIALQPSVIVPFGDGAIPCKLPRPPFPSRRSPMTWLAAVLSPAWPILVATRRA